ncbi:MAG: HAD family phosphatase [Nitrospirae bacterium]|nr:MAG: HAD family phosphatase [Nitrospirota bacterium]
MIRAILFDFGGVLATEGFREGLREIGRKNGLDPDRFFSEATELVFETGYVTGMATEQEYWEAVRRKTGIKGDDDSLRKELMERFSLDRDLLRFADRLRLKGYTTGILSDQTNWLDEINEKEDIFSHFDHVFNSYHLHKSKRDPSVFTDVAEKLGLRPAEILFVDDNEGNIKRAESTGMKGYLYNRNAGDILRLWKILNPYGHS